MPQQFLFLTGFPLGHWFFFCSKGRRSSSIGLLDGLLYSRAQKFQEAPKFMHFCVSKEMARVKAVSQKKRKGKRGSYNSSQHGKEYNEYKQY
jgi:hypothetical protein